MATTTTKNNITAKKKKKNTTTTTTTIITKEKSKSVSKTLGSLLRHMEGIELIVELKTGIRIRGKLSSSDEYMNLTLEDAIEEERFHNTIITHEYSYNDDDDDDDDDAIDYNNNNYNYNHNITTIEEEKEQEEEDASKIFSSSLLMSIRGPKIRYIHFPDNADLASLVQTGTERERAAANKYKRGKRR